jgi:hypothetical protein
LFTWCRQHLLRVVVAVVLWGTWLLGAEQLVMAAAAAVELLPTWALSR